MKTVTRLGVFLTHRLFLFIAILFLVGCNTFPKEKNASLSKELMEAAIDNFEYAQLSANIYHDPDQSFRIDRVKMIKTKSDEGSGFYAEVYLLAGEDLPLVVFRGTDEVVLDTLKTNTQKKLADALVEEVIKEFGGAITIGHSLGGGLALRSSLKYKNVSAYAFMTSWRTGISRDEFKFSNKRTILVENGEWLKKFTESIRNLRKRLKKLDPKNPPQYYKFNLLGGGAFKQHSIYSFARAMTKVAAKNGDQKAVDSLKINEISLSN